MRGDVRAEAAGWPAITVAGVGCLETEAAWLAAVEAATPDELLLLGRAFAAA
jgi:hypothetical protein